MATVHRVFVFGTLKEGFPNFATNRGRRLPGSFVTRERYPLYLVGERHSPWLVDRPGEGERVAGQVFEVSEEALAAMDALERIHAPDGYRRLRITVEAERGGTFEVFAYLKQAGDLLAAEVRMGPLAEYKPEHAALYRPRQ
ncbi:gamma-glutamylcyclotransferase family protein [Variovorax sp. OV329]|uniref:gamma-glutamylcyclotransferase family protein n=1 Tax=Variovorax sp. OV329 TaxID=1882825 RepID=UPI0008E66194|nr:gamma-glutamylcyclotransferase family protein [Variovorax sp. OV329]SFM75452.1 gamma-glutamylaminecyclotransferase [Variovorax sp. OV329]